MIPFLLLLPEAWRDFSPIQSLQNLVHSVPGSKTHKSGFALWCLGPRYFSSQSCPLWASSNSWITFSSGLPPTAPAPLEVAAPVSCNSLYPAFCLSLQFGGRSLPCGLTSLMDLKGVVGFFQFVQCFTCCYDGLSTSKLLMCWIITQKSITDYFVGFIRV